MELKYRQFQLEVNKTLNASYNPQAYVNYYKQYIIMLQADHQIIENSQYEYDADFVAKIRQKQMQLEQLINIEEIESSLQNLHLDIQRCSKLIQIRSYDISIQHYSIIYYKLYLNPGFLKQLLDFERSLFGDVYSLLSQDLTPFQVQNEARYKAQQKKRTMTSSKPLLHVHGNSTSKKLTRIPMSIASFQPSAFKI